MLAEEADRRIQELEAKLKKADDRRARKLTEFKVIDLLPFIGPFLTALDYSSP
jgi:hypothetical protein